MNHLTDPAYIKNLLRHYGLRPKDYMGQNFLIDEQALGDIVAAAGLRPSDEVLEVGPGLGVLTEQLVERAGRVVAVEKDRNLFQILRENFKAAKNIRLLNQDILRFNPADLASGYKIVANIPYYLTSKLVANFLTAANRPSQMVFLVQKEVAERMTARPGGHSLLSLSVQFYADPEIVRTVSKESFWPRPEVDSAIVRLKVKSRPHPGVEEKSFFRLLKWAFAGKRKQLGNTLAAGAKISKAEAEALLGQAGISADQRPQALGLEQWLKLWEVCQQAIKQPEGKRR